MMEDDSKSTASTSTEFSTGSSVGSNTPSLIGENLESFCLGETEKGAASEGINLNILLLLWDVDYILICSMIAILFASFICILTFSWSGRKEPKLGANVTSCKILNKAVKTLIVFTCASHNYLCPS